MDRDAPLLIKRYASRRLYNTETSDYVTLEDIAGFIRTGREVQIVDLKSGDDLTRQYLLQIIAEHESRGESVLPLEVLTDLVRSYTTQAQSVVPQFLAMSFDMLREGQTQMIETMAKPMAAVPGFEAMRAQQRAFLRAVGGGGPGWPVPLAPGTAPGAATEPAREVGRQVARDAAGAAPDELVEIRRQLADLQAQLAKMTK